jgi:hypothetical protein
VPELGPDDDIDFIPSGKSQKKAPRRVKPAPANDEDLPEAMPEPAPPRSRPKAAKPKPEPRPSAEPGDPDDDLPDLEAPRAGNTRPGA